MNEGWSASRIVTVLLLILGLGVGGLILLSMERQQEKLIELRRSVDELARKIATLPAGFSAAAAVPAAASTDGKDAIGRPFRASPGFTLEPPPGIEIPGRTVPRNPPDVPPFGGTLVYSIVSDPQKVNYYLTNDGITSRYIDAVIHERLFNINMDDPTQLVPELAVAWETGEDRLSFRFHLRKGVRFSDGSPFDAGDVVFSFDVIRDNSVDAGHLRGAFSDVESVRAIDAHTVDVRMKRPYWKALKSFGYGLRILPQEHFEKEIPLKAKEHGIDVFSVKPLEPGFGAVFNKFTNDVSPGTGPYLWKPGESWVRGQHFTLFSNLDAWVRALNPDHYRVERLTYRIIKDRVAQFEEFRKGNLDLVVVDHDAWDDQLSKDPTITGIANHYEYDHLGLLYSYIVFNCRKPPFDDPRVRNAIAHLMDRRAVLEKLERKRGGVPTCTTKPIYPEYSHDLKPRELDVERAKELLAQAGWRDTDGDGFVDKDGKPLTFRFSTPSARKWFQVVTSLLQDGCAKAGIRCDADPKEWAVFTAEIEKLEFEVTCLYASAADPWIDPYDILHSSQSVKGSGNYSGWSNPEADRVMEAMRQEFDPQKRAALFHQLNKLFHDETPLLLLNHGVVGVLLNKRVQGVKIRPTGLQSFDVWIQDSPGSR
jgi:peptide/nickel transport system substrate-binding protein